jgi:hypothetical protein
MVALATDDEVKQLLVWLHERGRETNANEVRRFLAGCRRHHYAGFGWELNESKIVEMILRGKKLWVMTAHVWFGDAM